MSTKTVQEVLDDIINYIQNHGGEFINWYIGIAKSPLKRLFNDHNVIEENDFWIFRKTETTDDARFIESTIIETCGTDGGTRGGDANTVFIYAYKKSSATKP